MPKAPEDILFMQRCLELAALGQQNVAPNPMVGAVLVHQNRIIGEGFHRQYGHAHAEVNAINSVAEPDQKLISESTIYVSLEPCSHHGKTPPCSDLIIASGIPRVVVGCVDSYSEVAGRGIEKLRSHGIEVSVGVLEKEARTLNKRFFTFHEKQRPYIILKWAQTTDGFIDKNRTSEERHVNWITQPETQQLTHSWRAQEAGILVGHQTVINDNPSLTVRAAKGPNPKRIVLTSQASDFPKDSKILNSDAETLFFNPREQSLMEILGELHQKSVQSVIVEGGKRTLEKFIEEGLWDEARVLTGLNNFGNGIMAPVLTGKPTETFKYGNDLIQVFSND
jgi:diaminohydroxyphosphoribosylaminopyrimidine deaminase/5-amino-6-(5-phosphoribosylamino)uracil reductase